MRTGPILPRSRIQRGSANARPSAAAHVDVVGRAPGRGGSGRAVEQHALAPALGAPRSPRAASWITPTTGPLRVGAGEMTTHQCGMPLAKFQVPSTGSTAHV